MLDIVLSGTGSFISFASIKLNPVHGILSGERITGLESVTRAAKCFAGAALSAPYCKPVYGMQKKNDAGAGLAVF